MIAQRKYLAALIAAAVLSACGGGSGGDGSITAGTGGTSTPTPGDTTTTPPTGGTTTPPGDTGTTTPPGDGGTTTPPGNGGTTTPPGDTGNGGNTGGNNGGNNGGNTGGDTVVDQTLRGHLRLINDQLIYLRTDRSIYNAVTLAQFEGAEGMYDVASGATTTSEPGQVQPPAAAPAAPLASFGFRIDKYVQVDAADQVIANQTVVGRVAFSFVERPNTAGIGANEVAENMSFVIDKVEMATDATGRLSSVRVLDGAQMIVTGRNAAGTTVQETIPVQADAVRLLDIGEVLDHYGDTSSIVLLVDMERAFSQAGTKLAALENLAGNFAMQATLSTVKIVDPADGSNAERNLVGSSITVGTQPAVTGAGVSGTAWVRMLPPTP